MARQRLPREDRDATVEHFFELLNSKRPSQPRRAAGAAVVDVGSLEMIVGVAAAADNLQGIPHPRTTLLVSDCFYIGSFLLAQGILPTPGGRLRLVELLQDKPFVVAAAATTWLAAAVPPVLPQPDQDSRRVCSLAYTAEGIPLQVWSLDPTRPFVAAVGGYTCLAETAVGIPRKLPFEGSWSHRAPGEAGCRFEGSLHNLRSHLPQLSC